MRGWGGVRVDILALIGRWHSFTGELRLRLSGAISERSLAEHNAGILLPPSLTLESAHLSNGRRTLTLSRPLRGPTDRYLSFTRTLNLLRVIVALGEGPSLSYHKQRAAASLSLLPPHGRPPVCLCSTPPPPFGEASGRLEYSPTNQKEDVGGGGVVFDNHCSSPPRSDLLAHANPACDLRTYQGGQIACRHMWALLDDDQPIPWADQADRMLWEGEGGRGREGREKGRTRSDMPFRQGCGGVRWGEEGERHAI